MKRSTVNYGGMILNGLMEEIGAFKPIVCELAYGIKPRKELARKARAALEMFGYGPDGRLK